MKILKQNKKDFFKMIRNQYYAEKLSISANYISNIYGGYGCSELIAKGLISVRYKIPINDEKMPELLDEYFYEEKD